MKRLLCRIFGHRWVTFSCVTLDNCDSGCSDRLCTCTRCGEAKRRPWFRRWRCPVHEQEERT